MAKFTIRRNDGTLDTLNGHRFEIHPGIFGFAHKTPQGWRVTEETTGTNVSATCRTRQRAIESARKPSPEIYAHAMRAKPKLEPQA